MAALANLSREERFGLGIAALLHVALVAALVWQVRDTPAKLPVPERIEVSLADDVSLTSTAPDPAPHAQADVAPVLAAVPAPPLPAPEPIPTVDVKPAPRQVVEPIRQPAVKPSSAARPSSKPVAKPSAAPAKAAGGTRLGNDFLKGVNAGDRTPATGTPAATFGLAERASLIQAVSRQLKPKWQQPSGVDVEKLVTTIEWELNEDGTLRGEPKQVTQTGGNDSNRPQQVPHREAAIRAIKRAAPFDLPVQYYGNWKKLRFTFDWKLN